jgi:hypothetical protein
MMSTNERNFRPLPDDLLPETLVPKGSFYRRLEDRIDLSFVRKLVLPLYDNAGRHSIDPVVFFKLQLVLFFEDLRSERQQRVAQRGPRQGGREDHEGRESPRSRASSAR